MTSANGAKPRRRAARRRVQVEEPVLSVLRVEGLECAAEATEQHLTWYWPQTFPADSLVLLEGRKGTGKTSILAALAAAVTGGPAPPGWTGPTNRRVIWCGPEESWTKVVIPRLRGCGARIDRVHRPALRDQYGSPRYLYLPDDVPTLHKLASATQAALLVLDPLSGLVHPSVDLRQDQQVRAALQPIVQLCDDVGCLAVGTRHLRKGVAGDLRDAGLGGTALINVSRLALRCDEHPHERGQYTLAFVAGNLGTPTTTQLFRLTPTREGLVQPEWIGNTPLSAEEIAEGRGSEAERDEWKDAELVLAGLIGDGWVRATACIDEAKRAAVSERTLRRAKTRLGVASRRMQVGVEGHWEWGPPKDGWPVALVRRLNTIKEGKEET